MAEAPTRDKTLTPDDAVTVLEEILEAQNQSYVLGLKLKLQQHIVEEICEKYSEPRDRLLQVLIEFIKQAKPKPTWRAIVAALRSPALNLPKLAMRVEAAHCPDPTATPPQTTAPTVIECEATSDVPPMTSPETSSSQTSAGTRRQKMLEDPRPGSSNQNNMMIENAELQQRLSKAEETIRMKEQHLREMKQQQQQIHKIKQQETEKDETRDKEEQQQLRQIRQQLTVQCDKRKKAPCRMARGSATTDDQFAYFTPGSSNSVFRYELGTESWEELPSCPHHDSGLVIINGELTAVGGYDGCRPTNKLFTLQQDQWVEKYPSMNTARFHAAVVSVGDYVLVIGGLGKRWTTTVELFHVRSRRWYQLTNLPQALTLPSATICGNELHVIGGKRNAYSFSLQALLSSDQPITSQSIQWKCLPRLPVAGSTAATLCERLVIIGGDHDREEQGRLNAIRNFINDPDVNTIYQLVDDDQRWEQIGCMSVIRSECLVVSSSPEELLIVGGVEEKGVEVCVVVNQERKTQNPVLPTPHTRKLNTSSTSQSTQQSSPQAARPLPHSIPPSKQSKDLSGYPDPTQPHHYYDDKFPGVCFLGEPLEYTVTSKQVTISPPNLGVTINIPSGAVPPGEHVTVTIRPCLSGSFQYPEGYEPLSAVYHITTNTSLKKKGTLTLEHFGDLQTKQQADNVTFFSAESSPAMIEGKKVYKFGIVKGGEFRMGKDYGMISLEHFCFTAAGTRWTSATQKRYIVLHSHTEEMTRGQHAAAIAVSKHGKVFIKNFRSALENQWGVPITKESVTNIFFQDGSRVAKVEYATDLAQRGWTIVPNHHSDSCTFNKEDVDVPISMSDLMYDYPPRIIFTMSPSGSARPCTFWLKVTGMTKNVDFQFQLRNGRGPGGPTMSKPDMGALQRLVTRAEGPISIIEESAGKFREIGTDLLNDRNGTRVDNITASVGGDQVKAVREIYRRWIQEDMDYCWTKLFQCLRKCGLNVLASQIEQHFGLPLP